MREAPLAYQAQQTLLRKGTHTRTLRASLQVGIAKMMAYVRGDNSPMIAIFEQAQFKRKFTGDPSDIELVLDVASLA